MPDPNRRFSVNTIPLPGSSALPFTPEVRGRKPEHNPLQVKHVKLTMFRNKGGSFIFCALPIENTARAVDIESYAAKLLKKRTGRMKGVHGDGHGTPFDIVLDRQCIVLLELDSRINWRFSPGSWGVSTEGSYGDPGAGHDFGPRFVTKAGITPAQDEARVPDLPEDGDDKLNECQILFFNSALRLEHMSQKFNFHIEFHQASVDRNSDGSVKLDKKGKPHFQSKCLPLIFDPDVGNNGGAVYPP
jgi:hypothetical protein